MGIFVATPIHDGRAHHAYVSGLLAAWGSGLVTRWSAITGTSLMRQRDQLVYEFVKTDCSHLLFVDSDIGWRPADAERLLAADTGFVAGCYCKKTASKPLAAKLLPNRQGELYEAEYIATGFLLVTREAVQKMLAANEHNRYQHGDESHIALFHQTIDEGTEDLAFCRNWRAVGGKVWLHTGVVLTHYDGNTPFVADVSELRRPTLQLAAAE